MLLEKVFSIEKTFFFIAIAERLFENDQQPIFVRQEQKKKHFSQNFGYLIFYTYLCSPYARVVRA